MIQCQNCGQVNTQTSNFCRFCGTKFLYSQFSNGDGYEITPPRPYSWKTDEFQVSDDKTRKTRQINQVRPLADQMPAQQPLAFRQGNGMAYGYHCPRCATQLFPRQERRISTAGWIVFAVLLVVFFPLFWIGLLIKEDVKICPVCNLKIS